MPDFHSHSLHLPHFIHADNNKSLNSLYVIRVFRDLVAQFCFFFYPIFLFNFSQESGLLNFLNLNEISTGMLGVALYFLLARLVMLLLSIPVGTIIHKQGLGHGLLFSFLFRGLQLVFLLQVPSFPLLIFLVILCEGIQALFFWDSYFTILSRYMHKQNVGKDLGVQQFLLQLVATITPAVSGAIALNSGFETLFYVGILFATIGIIASLYAHFPIPQDQVSFGEFMQWMKDREYEKFFLSYPGKYVNDAVHFLWPLYVFFFLGSIDRVGFLYTISLFIALLFTFLFGTIVDKSTSKRPFFASGGFLSILWIARTQVWNAWSIAFVDAFDRLTSNFHWLFFDTLFIRRGKGRKALSYFVYSEIDKSIIGIFFWATIALLFLLNVGWSAVFLTGAVGVLASLFITDHHSTPTAKRV